MNTHQQPEIQPDIPANHTLSSRPTTPCTKKNDRLPPDQYVPQIRVPAVVNGHLMAFNLSELSGQWITLCCPSQFGLVESLFLDQYRQEWERQGACLLGLIPGTHPFHESWIRQVTTLGLILLGDPLGRVSRALRIANPQRQPRCQSLIINPRGRVEYHLIHDLNGRGMSAMSEIFQLCKNFQIRLGTPLERESVPGFTPDSQQSGHPSGTSGTRRNKLKRKGYKSQAFYTLGVGD
jgi:alkyl hydroperoxide reductase subunit AhpC